jgi:sugar phosphate permease
MGKRLMPWVVAIAGLVVLMVSNGLIISGITAFDESLINEFGWARGDLKFRDLITLLLTGLVAPFIGVLIDRLGVRLLLVSGALLLSGAYFAYSHIASLTHVYLIHLVFAAVLVACGLNVAVIMVSRWFVTQRGTAIGIALVGTSLGGVFFPPLITGLIAEHGWRDTFQIVALAPMVMLLIGVFLARSPKEWGMQPLGAGSTGSDARAQGDPSDLTLAQALRTRSFWALAVVAGLTFYCMLGVIASLRLHLQDLGADPAAASAGFAWMMTMALVGKFLFGFLADHTNQRLVFLANLLVMLGGAYLLASMDPELTRWATTLFGLGWGGLYTLLQIQAVNNFGLSHAGKILGVITLIDATAGGVGSWMTNVLFARGQSYELSYQIMVGLMVVAFFAALLVRRPSHVK